MALIKCHECGNKVSTEAKTCPKCGATVRIPSQPPAKSPRVWWLAIGAVVIAMSVSQYLKDQVEAEKIQLEAKKTPEQRAAEAKAEAKKKEAEAKESIQDAAAALGAADLKKAMKDPASFKLTSLVVVDDGTACYEYRAVNSFGASLPSSAVMLPSGKMFVQDHDGDGNAFNNAWNKGCANKSGRQIVQIVEMSGTLN